MNAQSIQKEAAAAVCVSPKEFTKLMACRKKFMFDRMNLKYDGKEQLMFMCSAVSKMKSLIKEGAKNLPECMESFMEGYCREWFSCEMEWEAAKKNASRQITRLAEYVMTKEIVDVDVRFVNRFERPLAYRGMHIGSIGIHFDLITKKADGRMTGVIIHYGAPTESERARKMENLPSNSPELIAATLSARRIYGRDFRVELWYVKNKDDNGASVVEKFEHRPGKNVITANFSAMEDGELMKHLITMLSRSEKCDCEKCRHQCVCRENVLHEPQDDCGDAEVTHSSVCGTPTDAQQCVIDHVNGPMCVVAVPGAGKTESLVRRLVHLVKDVRVKPQKILFVTFTKKAAREIQARVNARLTEAGISGMPQIMTYNALGFSILKENPLYVGKRIRLAEDRDRYNLIFKSIQECDRIQHMSYLNPRGEHGIVRFLDAKFEELQGNGEKSFRVQYEKRYDVDGILAVYEVYRRKYEEAGFISFDDQISLVNELFEQYSVLPRRYADKYEYIMVDEFQDSTEEQVDMIYSIARYHNNLVVVGDDDQSIYQWRGGSSQFMLEFSYDFPQAKTIYMEDNFRSNGKILELCNAFIQGNGVRYEKNLVSHNDDGQKPVYVKDCDSAQFREVVSSILKSGVNLGDVAILARNNQRLEEVSVMLDGVCPVSIPKDYMIEDVVFTGIFDVMSLYYKGLDDDVAFYRYLRLFGLTGLVGKSEPSESLYANMVASGKIQKLDLSANGVERMAQDVSEAGRAMFALLTCFEKLKYGQMQEALSHILKACFHKESHLVVENLIDIAEERGFVQSEELYRAMEDMIVFQSTERVGYDSSKNAVNLLTAHDSKGKEFPVVVVYGMEDFSLTEEETRVLYVAMSRAKKSLYLVENANNRFNGFQRMAPYIKVYGGN